ncbi:MAG: M28 family peptidase, partial [Bacteroidota bacterium]
ELARVLSAYTFDHTMVFMLTIGEEQGLFGAEALAEYCTQQGIPVKAVLNNDIVGGIYCGNSASPPGCPGAGDIDSLNVRLFSHGGFNSPHKQLARFIKLQYQEELTGQIPTEMDLHIMSNEDRTGRGGDHIPFRQNGFSAMRFTSANEHGDGSPDAQYTDRQHTSDDSLGLDLDNDGDLDTFFVDFNYLARNAVINGNAAAMIGIGPETPDFTVTAASGGAEITIITQTQYSTYRVGVRSVDNDWDSVYTMAGTLDTLFGLPQGVTVIYSVASVDSNGIESLFSREKTTTIANLDAPIPGQMELLQNRPNPFDEQTIISVNVAQRPDFEEAYIRIVDAAGKEVQKIPITLEMDMNEVYFYHGFHAEGVYFYSLVIDGETWATRKMVMQR